MKKIFLLLLILCVPGVPALGVGIAAATSQDTGHADVYYRDGARFALEGRLAEAAKAFEQVVSLDPSNGNAYYSLGQVYSEMGRWADAVNAYYKALSLNKEDVEAYNALGIALDKRGQRTQAAAAFEKAIKIYPKWAEPYFHLSQVRRELGESEAAQAAYNRAIRLRPDYATDPPRSFMAAGAKPGPAQRSKILEAMNSVNLGGEVISENVNATSGAKAEAAPQPPPAPATHPTPSASETSSESARADSMDAGASYELGLKESRAGRYTEAVTAFRQAILLDRRNAATYLALGDAYAALGDWGNSVDAYEQSARLNPNDAEVYQRLGRSYAKLRETSPAPDNNKGVKPNETPESTTATNGETGARIDASRVENKKPADDPDPTAVYRVGPGDVLDIRLLSGRAHRAASFEVTPTGLLDYPALLEPLKAEGLTTEEVAARLGSQLKLRADGVNPEIAVGVREYASHTIIVGGMVKEAGTKILQREGVPLYVIIAYAQPLAGAGQAVVAARATGRSTTVDLSDVRAMKMLIRPGDVVTVRARAEQFFYIAGAIRQPGQKKFHPGMTLTQAVLAAGGVSTPVAVAAVISRQADDGHLSTTKYDLTGIGTGKVPDPVLQEGDRIEVLR